MLWSISGHNPSIVGRSYPKACKSGIMCIVFYWLIVLSFSRCVADEQRTLALGAQSVLFRAFGSIPGPIIFGAIFDSACIYWQYECSRRGNCWVYNNTHLSQRAVSLAMLGIAANLVFSFLSWLFYPKAALTTQETSARKKDYVAATPPVHSSNDFTDEGDNATELSDGANFRPTKRSSTQRMDSHCSQDVLLDSELWFPTLTPTAIILCAQFNIELTMLGCPVCVVVKIGQLSMPKLDACSSCWVWG